MIQGENVLPVDIKAYTIFYSVTSHLYFFRIAACACITGSEFQSVTSS